MTQMLKLFLVSVAFASLSFAATSNEEDKGALKAPVKEVLKDYSAIQKSLADDSLDGVAQHAKAIAKAVRDSEGKLLSMKAAEAADTIAGASDMNAARDGFKQLSNWLTVYLDENNVKSSGYNEMYCPKAKASWLQTDDTPKNPYMGKSAGNCGEKKRSF